MKKGNPNPSPETRFKPGNPGKPKGIPNKITRCMKAQTWRVFEALEADPEKSLEAIAKRNPAWFHSVFSSRIIPKDLNVNITLPEAWERSTDEEKLQLLEKLKGELGIEPDEEIP